MDISNLEKQRQPEEPRYLTFPCQPDGATKEGRPVLNKCSSTITKDHDFPGAQAMLYAAGVPDKRSMKNDPHVGVASVWWEGTFVIQYLEEWYEVTTLTCELFREPM